MFYWTPHGEVEIMPWDIDFHIVFTRKMIFVFLLQKSYIIVGVIALYTVKKTVSESVLYN